MKKFTRFEAIAELLVDLIKKKISEDEFREQMKRIVDRFGTLAKNRLLGHTHGELYHGTLTLRSFFPVRELLTILVEAPSEDLYSKYIRILVKFDNKFCNPPELVNRRSGSANVFGPLNSLASCLWFYSTSKSVLPSSNCAITAFSSP
ncbi:hypothetical protein L596_023924 [Steinernema carpocapsae]|uniref:Uncharacterized protein n=1 Tax=Steinernema carpocapsae TaxID=34508 RepID=A0A4V5ZZQ5_STECR|nr:hypothetical protein L596_023924 [Steinernema carpocapsae]